MGMGITNILNVLNNVPTQIFKSCLNQNKNLNYKSLNNL